VLSSARYALSLCSRLIIPSLFPFFVVSILLGRLGFANLLSKFLGKGAAKLFGVSGAGISAFFIGITGGYPLGAAYIAELCDSGSIDLDEAERLLRFCNNSGPAFIVGAIGGGIFGSGKIGLKLYVIHILAAVITGLLFRRRRASYVSPLPQRRESPDFSAALPEAVKQALVSTLNVCGFVVVFTVFAGLLDANGWFSLLSGKISEITGAELHFSRALITGLMELGSGVGAMQGLKATAPNLALAAAMVGWGGVSVHFQTLSAVNDSKINCAPHFTGRIMSAVISAALALIIF